MKTTRFYIICDDPKPKKKVISLKYKPGIDMYSLWEECSWYLAENFKKYFDFDDGYFDFEVKRGKYTIPFWAECEFCHRCGGENNIGFDSDKIENQLEVVK